MVTPSASATSLSELESIEQDPPLAKVSRKDEYVGLADEDSKRLKDTLRGKDRMEQWYVHRAMLRMRMEYEVQFRQADQRGRSDLEGQLAEMRDAVEEHRENTTRATAVGNARALELIELRR